MNLLSYLKRKEKKTTANLAKDRLQIVITHERKVRNQPSYLPELEKELLAVICKYVQISADDMSISIDGDDDNHERLEVNIQLPDLEKFDEND